MTPPSAGRDRWAILLVALVVQFLLQSHFFPLGELFTATPLFHTDSAFHQYQMEVARQLCAQHRLIGFDPYFAAGHMGGVTFNASAKLPALLSCALGTPASVAPVYKLFSFAMGVLAPALLVLAALLLRFDLPATALVAFFGIVNWWAGPMRWYHTSGLVAYVAVAHAVLPFVAGVSLACRAPSAGRLAALAATAAIGTLVHPLFVVAAVILCGPLLLGDLQRHGGASRIAWVALFTAAAVLLVNGPWLAASLSAPNFASVAQPYQRLVDPLLVLREPLGIATTPGRGSRLDLVFIVGTVAALRLAVGEMRRRLALWVLGAALLMLWASLGGLSRAVSALQPNRFSALAWLVLVLPGAWGLAALWRGWRERRVSPAWALVGLLPAAAIALFFARDAALEVFADRPARHGVPGPEVKGEGELSLRLVAWVRTHTEASARVYLENSLGRVHDGAHMAGTYALQTGRELIGGPYPYTDYASAWDGFAFGRPLSAIPPVELARLLDRYNVKWMLCHTALCRTSMAALPDAREVAAIGPVTAFERAAAASYFMTGSGAVTARCINRIDVRVQGAGPIVLKYHWQPGLATVPPLAVDKRFIGDDPHPFIAIARPAPSFSIGVGAPGPACP